MKIAYKHGKLQKARLALVEVANKIIGEYQRAGYKLTLRQLYYQFVARDVIPNTPQNYKQLGDLINEGRLLGLIDWEEFAPVVAALNLDAKDFDYTETGDSCLDSIARLRAAGATIIWPKPEDTSGVGAIRSWLESPGVLRVRADLAAKDAEDARQRAEARAAAERREEETETDWGPTESAALAEAERARAED